MMHEVFLSGYFSMLGPCKVLEFGCGFGRHLNYLRRIPGLDVHGCDQSPTMLAEAEKLIEKSWLAERTLRIEPRGELPYADKSFDVVYTASVLIHVRPEDVSAVLGELVRVARWHILHVENRPTEEATMTSPEHSGCWAHPLVSLYGQMGLAVETLPEMGTLQGGYRVLLDGARPAPDVTSFAGRLLETETSILSARQQAQQQAAEAQAAIDSHLARIAQLESQAAQTQRSLQQREGELEEQRAAIAELQAGLAKANDELSALQQAQARRLAAESAFIQQLQQTLKA
jgi:SAM-dependent methyltransferase